MSSLFRGRRSPGQAGKAPADRLPDHLVEALFSWCRSVIDEHPAYSERARLRLKLTTFDSAVHLPPLATELLQLGHEEASASLGPGWATSGLNVQAGIYGGFSSADWRSQVADLQQILLDGDAPWNVAPDLSTLRRRAVTQASQTTASETESVAEDPVAGADPVPEAPAEPSTTAGTPIRTGIRSSGGKVRESLTTKMADWVAGSILTGIGAGALWALHRFTSFLP